MDGTSRPKPEPRKAIMAVAKVSWEDEDKTMHTAPARIEDTSASGACFRLKAPLAAGMRVHVSWCRDDFTGTTKWCRAEGEEYVVGMRRDQAGEPSAARIAQREDPMSLRQAQPAVMRPADALRVSGFDSTVERNVEAVAVREVNARSGVQEQAVSVLGAEAPSGAPAERTEIHYVPRPRRLIRRGTLIPIPKPRPLPLMRIVFPAAVVHKPLIGFEIAFENATSQAAGWKRPEQSATYRNRTASFCEERTEMQNKWLNLGSKRQQQDGAHGNSNGGPAGNGAGMLSSSIAGDAPVAPPRGDLLTLEDIYRTAGIREPRMGYSITKVVEMLRSDHLRGLGDEVKRASVLMALGAAGIPLADILQDAAQRQSAVAGYESEQRRKFEEYWTRRAEENSLLQAEMERVTRQYVERMNRNLNEVQAEKELFQKWQNAMQQEVLQISEAVTLCAQPAVFESTAEQPAPAAAGSQNLVAKSA